MSWEDEIDMARGSPASTRATCTSFLPANTMLSGALLTPSQNKVAAYRPTLHLRFAERPLVQCHHLASLVRSRRHPHGCTIHERVDQVTPLLREPSLSKQWWHPYKRRLATTLSEFARYRRHIWAGTRLCFAPSSRHELPKQPGSLH